MSEIKYYLDENVDVRVQEQLLKHGIDCTSAKTLGQLGDSDPSHLDRAWKLGRVFCTHDTDLLRLNAQGMEHAGIIYAEMFKADIGGWVRVLRELHRSETAEDLVGQLRFVNVR